MTAEERAAFLGWPDRRNCDWGCPCPSYCVDCHDAAYAAMEDGRRRLLSVLTRTSYDDMPKVWLGMVRT